MLAAEVLLRLDDDAAKTELLPQDRRRRADRDAGAGERRGRPRDRRDRGQATDGEATAVSGDAAHGSVSPVLNGAEATVLLVPADSPAVTVIYLVDGSAAGLTRTRLTAVDHSRSLARIQLSGTPGRALAGDAAAALAAASDLANLALASESAGAMKACLDMTSAYARIRVAFGQPIGAFQAVKHRLADMEKSWELGYAALRDAARAGDAEPGRFSVAASVARVLLASAYAEAAVDTVQLHGGIGFTWEHDAHLYYKNGLSNKVLLGGPGDQLDRLADSLGI